MTNPIEGKSFQFALHIVNLCKQLQGTQKEYVLSKQLLRCGTSIGANVAEAQQAQTHADFITKMNIALKEASETNYWLRLLRAADYLAQEEFSCIYAESLEINRILAAIVKTAKQQNGQL